MYWAGIVVEVYRTYAVMEVRNEFPSRFVITHDTLWIKLPVPNAKLTRRRKRRDRSEERAKGTKL